MRRLLQLNQQLGTKKEEGMRFIRFAGFPTQSSTEKTPMPDRRSMQSLSRIASQAIGETGNRSRTP